MKMVEQLKGYIHGFLKYSNLLHELVIRDIKIKYRRSFLGVLWTVLSPLLTMIVITLVFSQLFKSDIPNFPVYLLSGTLLFNYNSEATNTALFAITNSAGLIKKVYIPKYLFVIAKVLSSLVSCFFSLIALFIVMIYTHAVFYPTLMLVLVPIFYLSLFTTGLSLILSAYYVYFRDIGHLYSVFLLAWTYLTPLFYPESILPQNMKWVLIVNPMYYYIEFFRELVLKGQLPRTSLNITCFGISILFLIIGVILFRRKQDKFILYI